MGDCPYDLLHRYSEESARMKLARHRQRGDFSLAIAGCPSTDHWHVYNIEEAAIARQGPMPVPLGPEELPATYCDYCGLTEHHLGTCPTHNAAPTGADDGS